MTEPVFPAPGADHFVSMRNKKRGVAFSSSSEAAVVPATASSAPVKPRSILKGSTSSLVVEGVDLNASVGGTPRNVLRERLRLKDQTICKLDADLKELQEFTKDELEIMTSEKDDVVEQLKIALKNSDEEKRQILDR